MHWAEQLGEERGGKGAVMAEKGMRCSTAQLGGGAVSC